MFLYRQQQAEASAGMSDIELVTLESALTEISDENLSVRLDLIKGIALKLNTQEAMSQFVDIMYEKAVNENSCPVIFAKVFKRVSSMSLKKCDKNGKQQLCFRTFIINKCQKNFQMWTGVASTTEGLVRHGAYLGAKKVNLEAGLVCEELDQRYIRNLLLIGEMYNQHLLTSSIMMRIIGILLAKKGDAYLESLCKLLTIIGKILETQCDSLGNQSELNKCFTIMEQIMNKSQTASGLRSLLGNVIEMRKNNWLSVGEDMTGQTPVQLHHQEHGLYDCGVCMHVYDEMDHRPRTLPCGHTYCSSCVSALLVDGCLTCPSCRTNHCATDASQFPICFALEAIMKAAKVQQVEAASVASGETAKGTRGCDEATSLPSQTLSVRDKWRSAKGLSKKMQSMIDEQRGNVESLKSSVQDEVEQLKQYRTKLAEYRADQVELIEELETLRQQAQSNIELLLKEDARVEALVGEGEEVEKELRTACIRLQQITESQKAFTCIDEADHMVTEVDEWLQHIREDIPNGPALRTAYTMFTAMKKGLEVIKEARVPCDQVTPGHLDCTIMEAVEGIEIVKVEFVDLRTERLKKSLENGRVFAVQKYEDGTCYSSKVISKENKLYLNALKKEPPPPAALTLQVNETLENLDLTTVSIFLDLTWPGASTSQRVSIQLTSDTPLTKYFAALCLGHTGRDYCNTNLAHVNRCNGVDLVWGPDIRHQKAITNQGLPSIQTPQYTPSAGMVMACITGDTIQFCIAIYREYHDDDYISFKAYPLGNVDSNGQSVLRQAVDMDQIPYVRVENCGVVCD